MAKPKILPDRTYLIECFTYEAATGALVWKERPRRHFKTDRDCLWWNKVRAGTPAGTRMTDGYIGVHIDGSIYKAHRIIWLMLTGNVPERLDHKNGNPADNRIENLREASCRENRWNSRHEMPRLRGVYPTLNGTRWTALHHKNGRVIRLGTYDTPEAAHAAWCTHAQRERGEFFRAD